jgi:predicted PurR-regulated permease PerM
MSSNGDKAMPDNPTPEHAPWSIASHVILAAALLIFIQTFSLLSPIILSFLLIMLISLSLNPVVSRMRALIGGRKIPAGLVTAGLITVVALLGWALFVPMKASIMHISDTLPGYWERLQKPLIKIEQRAVLFEEKLQAEVRTEIALDDQAMGTAKFQSRPSRQEVPDTSDEDSQSLRSSLMDMLQGALSSFTAVAFNGAQILVVLVTVFFGVIFMLMNPRPIVGMMFALLPERHYPKALVIMQRIGEFVPVWAGATLLGMVTIGVLVFLLMWPIFGFMDALVLGMIAGILEIIPFLGPIISTVPAILLALAKGGMTPLWVLIAYLVVQALEGNVIMPFIMARGLKLHPLAVIFSMLLCVATFGVLGVLVAAPLVAIVSIVHTELYRKHYLPTVTDADLVRLARIALHEKLSDDK